MNARTTPTTGPLVPQTFCSDGKTIAYNVGTGWPLMATATAANGLIAERDTLRAQNAELRQLVEEFIARAVEISTNGAATQDEHLELLEATNPLFAALTKVQKESQP